MRFRLVKMKGVLVMHGITNIFTKEKTDKVQTITSLEVAEMVEKEMQSIYVVEKENGNVKIGVSSNVRNRIKTLSSQGGFVIKNLFYTEPCSNAYEIEKEAHATLSTERIMGEWFSTDFFKAKQIVEDLYGKISCKETRKEKVLALEEIENFFVENKGEAEADENLLFHLLDIIDNLSMELSKEYFNEKEVINEEDFWKVSGDFYQYAKGMNNRIHEVANKLKSLLK